MAKIWSQAKCPLRDEWIKKMWYVYTMEYYFNLEKKEILHYAKTWMNLEDITRSEISQRKTNICMFPGPRRKGKW